MIGGVSLKNASNLNVEVTRTTEEVDVMGAEDNEWFVYNKLGYIPQKAVMFDGTVNYNVSYGDNGKGETSQEKIKASESSPHLIISISSLSSVLLLKNDATTFLLLIQKHSLFIVTFMVFTRF